MTRINVVPPSWLTTPHLIAEYRELPRVFDLSRKAQHRGDLVGDYIMANYTMGTGHVKFFYPRLRWCHLRQERLIDEMLERGYQPKFQNPAVLLEGQDKDWMLHWQPSKSDVMVNMARLISKDPGHYSKLLTKV